MLIHSDLVLSIMAFKVIEKEKATKIFCKSLTFLEKILLWRRAWNLSSSAANFPLKKEEKDD